MSLDPGRVYVFDASNNKKFARFLARDVRDLYRKYRYVIYNFINTSLQARYRRSLIGFLWSLLNPLITMVILAVVFSTIYNLPFGDFGIYIFSGLLPWSLISNGVMQGSTAIIRGEGYLKKVYVPKLVFPLVSVGVEVLNFLFSLVGLFLMATFLGAKISWGLAFLPVALTLTALFILGLVLATSIVTVYFRDLSHIIQILFTGLFYLTPIIYKESFIPDRLLNFIKLNPFVYFVKLFHVIIYEAKIPDISLWLICTALMIASLFLGVVVFSLKEEDVVYRL